MSAVQGWTEKSDISHKTELVVVCCHATYLGDGANTGEHEWIMQDFQRSDPSMHKPSEHETFIAHVLTAAMIAQHAPQTLLIFSGGKTTPADRSEAHGYGLILEHMVRNNASLFSRTIHYACEEYSTDSYQNLLFSILRFRQLTGAYPQLITVITHAFKERRFLEQHAPAIKWPGERIRVQGVNPPFTLDELNFTQKGERERAYNQFNEDPYGVRSPLSQKRRARNWNPEKAHIFLGYGLEQPIFQLLEWMGGVSGWEVFPAQLPWERPRNITSWKTSW